MAQSGSDIAQNLKDSFESTLGAPFKAVGDAVKKYIPSSLMPSPSSSSSTHANWTPEPNDEQKQQIKNENQQSSPKPATKPPVKKPSYEKGTDYVPKTGPAVLHKGEAVLNKEDAEKHREAKNMKNAYDVSDELGGKKEEKPKKEIKHMHIKKASNGGHIIRHEHTHPEHHPDEEHTTKTDDELADHVLQNMGTPNPGEAEADAGQSGVPGEAAGAAPQAGTPAAGTPPMGA